MTVTINLNCDNATFSEDAGSEIARILRELADTFEQGLEPGDRARLRDINGNKVGECRVIE